MAPLGTTKLSVALGSKCMHRDPQTGTAPSPLITYDQLNCWFDFFNSILLIPGWVKLVEPYKVRFDIDFGVPDKAMLRQPLLGPGC